GAEEEAQVLQLDALPVEAAADVEGEDAAGGAQRFAEEDGAVEATAHEDGAGRFGGGGRGARHRLYCRRDESPATLSAPRPNWYPCRDRRMRPSRRSTASHD